MSQEGELCFTRLELMISNAKQIETAQIQMRNKGFEDLFRLKSPFVS